MGAPKKLVHRPDKPKHDYEVNGGENEGLSGWTSLYSGGTAVEQ